MSTLPSFIPERGAHYTELPDRGSRIARQIITHCYNGKLETFMEDD